MTASERQKRIIERLETYGGVIKVNDIAKRFNVSNETARRDIEFLKEQDLLTRVYGGAILSSNIPKRPVSSGNNNLDMEKKMAIAKVAASMVKDGESIFVGIGSTMLHFVRCLKNLKDLTIITPNLPIAMDLINTPFKVFVLGGLLDPNELDLYGPITLNNLDFFHVDKAFMSAGGISIESGVSDYNPNGYGRHAKMSSRADMTIVVAQSDKFEKVALSIEMPISKVDVLITDNGLSEATAEALRQNIKKLVIVPIEKQQEESEH